MYRLICAAAVASFTLVLATPADAAVSCTLTSKDGSVTVGLGGIGGDNVTGVVLDASGSPVTGAAVDIHNRTQDETGDDESGVRGGYDIDLDAEVGDEVTVFVTWTDARGVEHDIQGDCTLK